MVLQNQVAAESNVPKDSAQVPSADVALRAFDKWTARGRPAGTDLLDWQEAEIDLHQIQLLSRQLAVLQQRLSDTLSTQAQAVRRLAAEHGIAKVLAVSSTLDDAASGILQGICDAQGWDLGVMWTIDRAANVLRCCQIWCSPQSEATSFMQATRDCAFAPGVGLPGRVWASQCPMSIHNMSGDDTLPRAGVAALDNLHGAIAFPIRNGVEFLGVLEFFSQDEREPVEDVTDMMTSIGSQISQFIERRAAEAIVTRDRDERRVAGRIQQALLPTRAPVLAGFRICGRCIGAQDVCGDCFDFLQVQVGSEQCLSVLIADASGHGMGAALRAMETRAYVRVLASTCDDLWQLLTLVHVRLADALIDEGFVTALLLRLEPMQRRLFYAGAGHCTGFVMDKGGEVRSELASSRGPLGIESNIFPETANESSIALQPGDIVLLYTDGAVEASNAAGEFFGGERLLHVVRECRYASPEYIVEGVFRTLREFCGKDVMEDDLTVIIIKAEMVAGHVN